MEQPNLKTRMCLKDQLFECLPAGSYALVGLLRLLDVVETTDIPTAAVECRAQPRLLINPDFVRQHAQTPEKLMMLVMHEIHHVLLGHTRRIARATEADNFVFDCIINALLSKMFPAPEFTSLFTDYYAEDRFPACLLRPPQDWTPVSRAAQTPLPSALQRTWPGVVAAREVYRSLYANEGASYEDLRRLLPLLSAQALEGVPLLGGHDDQSSPQGMGVDDSSDFAQSVAELVRQWPAPPELLKGQSLDGMLAEARMTLQRPKGNRQRLRQLIQRLATQRSGQRGVPRPDPGSLRIESPIAAFQRRSLVLQTLGRPVLLHPAELAITQPVPAGERVHVYLDVSGSMESIKGALYGALLDTQAWLAPGIHLFSTEVATISQAQLRQGVCQSTGGTDIRCVVQHMKANRVRKALLVTDGYVGVPQGADARYLRETCLGVAYTRDHSGADLAKFARHSVVLDI